jgi:hypothetical protein
MKKKKSQSVKEKPPQQTAEQELANLQRSLGTTDHDFVNGIIAQLITANTLGNHIDDARMKFALAVIRGIDPKDQLESLLATQMAAVHVTFMKFARHFDLIESLPQQDAAERALNKLVRTFAIQMETLKRYRTGGEQKVLVQHVSIGEGAQAILGNVTHATAETERARPTNLTPALTDARQPSMPIIGDRKRARVPLQRRQKNDGQPSA